MKYYPAFLDLAGAPVLVIGGGKIAFQKAQSLLACGARVAVVARKARPGLAGLAAKNRLALALRAFRPGDLSGKRLVVCATDDERLNAQVGAACRRRGVFVNVVDRPALCTFIVPALARRGDVTFAVSTGGASPALAGFLRRRLQAAFGPEVGALAAALKKMRGPLRSVPMARRKKILQEMLTGAALAQFRRASGRAAFERKLKRALGGLQ